MPAHYFGKNCAGLRGKSVRVKPERVNIDVVVIPRDFYKMNKFVNLVGDVIFVNGLPSFMLTRSSCMALQLGSLSIKVVKLYALRRFVV